MKLLYVSFKLENGKAMEIFFSTPEAVDKVLDSQPKIALNIESIGKRQGNTLSSFY
ncbi:hypothetical protein [Lactococcus formosensis]|uniref:hypothetical protein n=1 Tax=Lactococcus formosensis TaxID=1281486 RepID=UPI00326395C2